MKHQELIGQMTLEEKALLLSGADTWHTHSIERLGIPAMGLSDGPSGLRRQAGDADHLGLNESTKATCIPSAATIANSWSEEVAYEMGSIVGADAAAQDVQVLLGPGINTKRSPLCGRSFEYYSEDPYLAGKLAAGYIRGVQSKGVSACVKHFAVNSQEMLRMHSDSVIDERTLRELYLTNFEIAVKEGKPNCLMTSYNRVNGIYTNENPHLLQDILRGEWGFQGMVVTDWGGSNSYVEGVRAGMNLEMPAAGDDSALELINAVKDGTIREEIVDERVDQLLDVVLAQRPEKRAVDVEEAHARVRQGAEQCIVLLKNEDHILPLAAEAKVAVIGDFAEHPRYQGAGSSMVNPTMLDDTLAVLRNYFPHTTGYAQGFERADKPNEEMAAQAVKLAAASDCVLLYLGLPEGYETEGLDRVHMRLPSNQVELLKRVAAANAHIIVVLSAGSAVEMPWIDLCSGLVYGCLGGQAAATAMLKVLSGEVNPSGKLAETFALEYADMPVSHYYPGMERTAEYREGSFVGYRYFAKVQKPVRFPFGYGMSYTEFSYGNLELTPSGVAFEITNTGECAGAEAAQLYITRPLPQHSFIKTEHSGPSKQEDISDSERKQQRNNVSGIVGSELPGKNEGVSSIELKGFTKVYLEPGECKRVEISFDEYTFRRFDTAIGRWVIDDGTYGIWIGASCEDIRLKGSAHVQAGNDGMHVQQAESDFAVSKANINTRAYKESASLHASNSRDEITTDETSGNRSDSLEEDQSCVKAIPVCYITGDVTNVSDEDFARLLGHAIPESKWDRTAPLEMNDTFRQMIYAKNPIARKASAFIGKKVEQARDNGTPDLNMLFIYNITFRGMAKLMGGMMTMQMCRDLVYMCNGHWHKGLYRLIRDFFHKPKVKPEK